ncbi:MAG: molecular chaperone TorD family protein [Desulfurococcales archaeon]|nr:molecular chaperone TorD family protein [Desulfurococcales archaeon]
MPLDVDRARRGVYAFLSRVLTREVELDELDALREAVGSLPAWLGSRASQALEGDDEDVYLSLKVDFTKTFLLYIHPYESVFRDPSGLLCTDLSVSVKRYYQKAGYEPDLASTGVRCFDHIGLELEFMARLIEEGDVGLQVRFMEDHLGRWAPVLGIVVSETASTGFYRTVGEMLAHFILADYEYLSGEVDG